MNLSGKPARRLQYFTGQFRKTATLPLREQRFHRTKLPVNFHKTNIPKIFMVILTQNQCADKYTLTYIIVFTFYNKTKIFMKIIFTQVTRPEQYLIHRATWAVVRRRADALCARRRPCCTGSGAKSSPPCLRTLRGGRESN